MPTVTRNKTFTFRENSGTYTDDTKKWVFSYGDVSFGANGSKTGVSLKNYRDLIKRGQNATTNFSGTLRSLGTFEPFGVFLIRYLQNPLRVFSHQWTQGRIYFPNYADAGGVSDVTANNLALRDINRAIRQTRTHIQGQIFLGEAREALRMITSPAKALRQGLGNYVDALKKRTARVPKKSLNKVIGETWLEYSFGWVPLIHDLDDAHKAYYKLGNQLTTSRITRQGSTEASFVDFVNAQTTFGSNVLGLVDQTTTHRVSVRYVVGMRTTTKGAAYNSVSERLGLTINNFAATAWELLPWSFLVDYFTNIGDIIDAGCVNTNDVIWVCKTVRREGRKRASLRINSQAMLQNYGPTAVWGGNPGTFETLKIDVDRTPYTGSLVPRFEVSVPRGPIQWINMGALAISLNGLYSSFKR